MKKPIAILISLLFVATAFADTAKQVDFLFNGYRHPTTDRILSGGKVKTYLTGTSTLSPLWTDKDKTATAANPVILSSAGRAEVYGDGVYKFEIYDSSDVLIETIDGIEYKAFVDIVSDDVYSASGWNGDGTTSPSKNSIRDKIVLIDAAVTALEAEDLLGARKTVTAKGDLIIGASPETLTRLPIGSNNQRLFATGETLEYAAGFKFGSFTRTGDAASGTVTITGVGFKPSHVLLIAAKTGQPGASVGFSNGTSNSCIHNNAGTAAATWAYEGSYSIVVQDAAAANQIQYASLGSFAEDSFVVTWVKGAGTPTSATITVYYMAYR